MSNLRTRTESFRRSMKMDRRSSVPASSDLKTFADMIQMDDLSEKTILNNIYKRYIQDLIYTKIGNILVAVNPYKILNELFSIENVRLVSAENIEYGKTVGTPHIFSVARAAFFSLKETNKSQSILISGESGAGKTESMKLILQYYSQMFSDQSEGLNQIQQMILETNPIMEAFGNAKTTKNNNSSRFGKFIQLTFDNHGMSGASVIPYLLEKSRVCRQGQNERNFHIFYQLLSGVEDDEKKLYGFNTTSVFKYLSNGTFMTINGIDDSEDFFSLKDSFSCVNIQEKDQESIFAILAAILHIGNISFEGKEKVTLKKGTNVALISQLLKVDQTVLNKALTMRSITVKNQRTVINLKLGQANDNKDTLSKTLYEKLFLYLINTLNRAILERTHKNWVGILDIFGFEDLQTNSLEQLLINYTNEKLKTFSNEHIFKLEQEEYEKEKIDWTSINFKDDLACLHFFENRGLFSVLDEQCKFPNATDSTFLEKMISTFPNHSVFSKPKLSKDTFVIAHYAANVTYSIHEFLEKNRNTLLQDVIDLCHTSKNSLVASLFQHDSGTNPNTHPTSGTLKQKPTVVSLFKKELDTLVTKLLSTETYFVRCVKPNLVQRPGNFDKEVSGTQLTYLNMQETVKIRKLGFPIRFTNQEFIDRYRVLGKNLPKDKKFAAEQLVKQLNLDTSQFQKGLTKVFFKQTPYNLLEEKRNEALLDRAIIIQAWYRGIVLKKYFNSLCHSTPIIQSVGRTYIARFHFKEIQKATRLLQGVARMLKAKNLLAKYKKIELEKRLEREKKEREEQERLLREKREQIQRQKEEAARKKKEKELEELRRKQQETQRLRDEEEKARILRIQEEEKLRNKLLEEEAEAQNSQFSERLTVSLDVLPTEKGRADSRTRRDSKSFTPPRPQLKTKISSADLSAPLQEPKPPNYAELSKLPPPTPEKKQNRKIGLTQEDRFILKKEQDKQDMGTMKDFRTSKMMGTGKFATSSKDKHISLRPNTLRNTKVIDSKQDTQRQSILQFKKDPSSKSSSSKIAVSKSRFPTLDKAFNNSNFISSSKLAAMITPIFTVLLSTVGSSSVPRQTTKTRTRGKTTLNPNQQTLPELVSPSEAKNFTFLTFAAENFQSQSTGTFRRKKLKPEDLIVFQKDKLHASLLRLSPESQKQALEIWIALLSYIGIGTQMSENLRDLASKIIFAGITSISLRDEIFCQLMKVLTRPPQIFIAKRAWTLFACCCACFVPSHKLLKYVAAFIQNHIQNPNQDLALAAAFTLKTLRRNYAHNFGQDRRLNPSAEEYDALEAMKRLTIIVYFYDGFELEVEIDSASTVQAVFTEAINCVGLKNESKYLYALMESHNELERTLHMDENICDIMSKWEYFRQVKQSNTTNEFGFFIKQHIFISSYLARDLVQEDLLFHQSITTILRGVWPTEEKDAILLGAYQACFENITNLTSDSIYQFIPRPLFHLHKPEEWAQLLKPKIQQYSSFSHDELEASYVQVMKQLPLFGFSVFQVTHKDKKWDLPDSFDLHIHENRIEFAISIPRARVKRVLRSWTYDEIVKVTQTETSLGLTLIPLRERPDEISIPLNTIQGVEIYSLIREYTEHWVKGSKIAKVLFDIPPDKEKPEMLAAKKGQILELTSDLEEGTFEAEYPIEQGVIIGKVHARNIRIYKKIPDQFAISSKKEDLKRQSINSSIPLLSVPERKDSDYKNSQDNIVPKFIQSNKLASIFSEKFRTSRTVGKQKVDYQIEERLTYSSRHLDHSLLPLDDKFDRLACDHFSLLLKYIEDRGDPTDSIPHLTRMIKTFIIDLSSPITNDIVDEIFVQAMKQTKGNQDYSKNLKSWAYFSVICGIVSPSEWLEKYIFSHIETYLVDPTEVGQFATDSYKRFNGLLKHAAQRSHPPSPEEMLSIFYHEIFTTEIFLPNSIDKISISVEPWMTVDEAIWKVCLQIGVKNDINYALWEVDPSVQGSVLQLNGNHYFVDVLFLMEAKQASFSQTTKHNIIFKRDIAQFEDKSLPTLEVELNLLFDEAVYSVISNTFILESLTKFVALQLEIQNGDCDTQKDPFSTIGRMIESNLRYYMSRQCFNTLCQNLLTYKQFIKAVQDEWIQLEGVPAIGCKKIYIEEYFSHPLASSTVFPVEERGKKPVLFCINASGIFIVKESSSKQEVLKEISWKYIQSWRIDKDIFQIKYGSLAKPQKPSWSTKNITSLSFVFQSYNTILVERHQQKKRGEERIGPRKRFEENRKSRITQRLSTRSGPIEDHISSPKLRSSANLRRTRGESRPKSVQAQFNFEDFVSSNPEILEASSPLNSNNSDLLNNNNRSSALLKRGRGQSIKDQFHFG